MVKPFREKLADYLLNLEKELDVPERYRNSVMALFDKTEQYGKKELNEQEFDGIKSLARTLYLNQIGINENTDKIRESIKETVEDLGSIAQNLSVSVSEFDKEYDQVKKAQAKMEEYLSEIKENLEVITAIGELRPSKKRDKTPLN